MKLKFEFPVIEIKGIRWCRVDFLNVGRIDVASYHVEKKPDIPLSGSHRHRHYSFSDGIHIRFPEKAGSEIDITNVKPNEPPRRRHGRH